MIDDETFHRYCPYCLEELVGDNPICPHCRQDTRNDAVHELTPAQRAADGTKTCPSCGREIHALATICPHCRAPNNVFP